ncbi:MAG: hypothetical protein H7293_09015 [Candidatus Saccharibacteria bacterium]|nr:hypothetical protein [Rhodoferax sp.]
MSNSATIRIECDSNTISIDSDFVEISRIGQRQIETSTAYLGAMIAGSHIRELMTLPKAELWDLHLATLQTSYAQEYSGTQTNLPVSKPKATP